MPETEKESMISRRKLLASIGLVGVAAASGGILKSAGFGTAFAKEDSVTDAVYGTGKPEHWKDLLYLNDLHFVLAVTIEELRAKTDPDPLFAYYVTNEGQEGVFRYDPNDTATMDNTGTVLVSVNGKRFKRMYGDTVYASWFGTKADGVTVDTEPLQSALYAAAGRKLLIPQQKSGYYLTGQLLVPSQSVIVFEPGTVVQAVDSLSRSAPYERLIRIRDAKEVYVRGNGATLRMNKAAYTSGEQAHIFDISGSENVVIEDINANDSGGDGFYIGAYLSTTPYNRNITLRNCRADNNRRQGLSVISVDGLQVENCRFSNTKGTAPQSGVDIEPNGQLDLLKHIRFVNCTADGNVGRGFLVSVHRQTDASERIDIVFQGCRTKGNSYGYSMNYGGDGSNAVQGDIKLIDCTAESEQYAGFSDLSFSADSAKRSYIRCKAVNCNTVNQPDDPYGFGSSFILTTVPAQPRNAIGNAVYIDCEGIDTRKAPLMKRGFAAKQNKAETIRGVRYVNCSVKGGGQSLYSIDPATEDIHAENHPQLVQAFPSSGAVSPSHIGCKITNTGAAGDIRLVLPAAKSAIAYTFFVEAPYGLTVAAAAGGTILTPSGPKAEISASAAGSSISLLGRKDGRWEITQAVGEWG